MSYYDDYKMRQLERDNIKMKSDMKKLELDMIYTRYANKPHKTVRFKDLSLTTRIRFFWDGLLAILFDNLILSMVIGFIVWAAANYGLGFNFDLVTTLIVAYIIRGVRSTILVIKNTIRALTRPL